MSETDVQEEPRFFLGAITGFMFGILATVLFAGALTACGVAM